VTRYSRAHGHERSSHARVGPGASAAAEAEGLCGVGPEVLSFVYQGWQTWGVLACEAENRPRKGAEQPASGRRYGFPG